MLLITIAAGPDRGRALRLPDDSPHIIGRKNGSLALDDPKVSRRHAELVASPDGRVVLKDLGSRNGTYVDKKKITGPTPLRNGAVIQIGQTVCVLSRISEEVASTPASVSPPPEMIESQEQTQRLLAEVRDGLARLQSAHAPGAHGPDESAMAQRLDEVSQRLAQLCDVTQRQAPQLDAILAAQSRPLSATEALAAELSDLHRKLDAMAAESKPVYDDTAVHARLDEVADALHRLAEPEPQPAWIGGLEQSIAASHTATVEAIGRHVDGLAAAADSRLAVEGLAGKVQWLIESLEAMKASSELFELPQAISAKLEAVLSAVQAVAPAAGAGPGGDTAAICEKLDDVLALVAAQRFGHEPTGIATGAPVADVESRLDAILRAVTALGEAVLERPDSSAATSGDPGHEALLLHVAERIDAMASQAAAAPPAADDLLAEVDRHWVKLEERLMQHLRGTSEAAEGQMRKALSDLTTAIRTMAERSDRAVLEQVLGELRGQPTQAMQEMLTDISERVRRLPTHAPATVDTGAIAAAVRQGMEQVGEELAALPQRLENNLVLGDILDLLRSIERNQRRQGQWMLNLDDKLDSLSASETAVFAPITDVPLGAEAESSSVTSQF